MPNRNFAICLLLLLLASSGAFAADLGLPETDAVSGWERQGQMRRFTAADLYGHINGGAELFLELGFKELLVQPYVRGEREIALEVYRMESPMAALAVYLFKCGDETPWPEIKTRNSSTRFQAVLVRGACFVLVNSFSGDEALRSAMAGLAGKLLETIPASDPDNPFSALPADGRISGSQRLIRGEYSLQSLYTFGPGDVLQLDGEIFGVAADYESAAGGIPQTRIHVTYPDAGQASRAFAHLRSVLDPSLKLLEQSPKRLIFSDYAGRFGLAVLETSFIEIRVNLPSRPGEIADTPMEP